MRNQQDQHEWASLILWQAALGTRVERADLRAAKLHVAHCSACWRRWKRMVETITEERTLSEAEAQANSIVPAGLTYGEHWRLQHLRPELTAQPGQWQRGHGCLARLSQDPGKRTLALIISVAQSMGGQTPVVTLRGEERSDRGAAQPEVVLQCNELTDVEATVIIQPDAQDISLVRIAVEVSVPDRFPDFSGVEVLLDDGQQQQQQVTGSSGRLEFGGIPRDKLEQLNIVVIPPA